MRASLRRAARHLAMLQHADGHWHDYNIRDQDTVREAMPIGPSDQWATAYAGLALGEAALVCGGEFRLAAMRACDWLERSRTYPAGWGFNGHTGPDVDSTAHALLLMRRCDRAAAPRDIRFLLSGAVEGGGFATFPHGPGEWGRAHADVSCQALLALPADARDPHRAATREFLRGCRGADGLWPSYWWKTPYYGTYFALRIDRALGLGIDGDVPHAASTAPATDPCDAAFLAGIHLHRRGPGANVAALMETVFDGQSADGSWPGTASLRVPTQGDPAPWSHDGSPLYRDMRGVLTTAHIVRVLARIAHPMSELP